MTADNGTRSGSFSIEGTRVCAARATAALAALLLGTGTGCLFETPRSCGPNMVLNHENVCVCASNAVLATDAHGYCVPCGANQIAQAGVCTCTAGLVRDANGACVPPPEGLNEPCDPSAPACPSANYPHCQPAPLATSPSGYCTRAGCAQDSACPSGYACDTTVAGGVCSRPPSGQGLRCSGSSDCAAYEASFCAPILNQCLYQGCMPGGSPCSPGHLCCDLTALGAAINVCLPVRVCP